MSTSQKWMVPPTESVSRESGRYLLELYFASLETDDRVSTGVLGTRLGVHTASVTEMVSKFADRGVVDYQKHDGVTLTTDGEELAESLAWRFCVTDRYFDDVLGAPVDRITAYQIGFELPLDAIVSLAETVDIPCKRACSQIDTTHSESQLDA